MVLVYKKILATVPREVMGMRILSYVLVLSVSGFLHGEK